MPPYTIDNDTMLTFLVGLLETPSPTGFHELAIAYCKSAFRDIPISFSRTRKGLLVGEWEGVSDDAPRALTAHIDTLGAMVQKIKSNGQLKLTQLGGWTMGVSGG